jgi:hypothetical protein
MVPMTIHDDGPKGLCAELRTILADELGAGNRIARVDNDSPGASPVVVPVHHGKVKPYYVHQIKKLVQGD